MSHGWVVRRVQRLPNLALWDQGAPPAAARWACQVGTVAASIPARQAPASLRLAAGRRGAGDRRQRRRWRRTGGCKSCCQLAPVGTIAWLVTAACWARRSAPADASRHRPMGTWSPDMERNHPDTAGVGDALRRRVKAGKRALTRRCGALDPAVCRGGCRE